MKAETIRLVPPQKKLPPPLSARVKPLPKVEESEVEKVQDTIHYLRQGFEMGFHKRKIDTEKIRNARKFILETLDKLEAYELKQLQKK